MDEQIKVITESATVYAYENHARQMEIPILRGEDSEWVFTRRGKILTVSPWIIGSQKNMHEDAGHQRTAAGQSPTVIRVIIMAAVAMAVIDGIVVGIALPTITKAFSVDVAQSQWIFTAYLVTETSLLLIFGRVSEFTGKNRLFLAGLVLFTTSSLACGLSSSLWDLVVCRVLQAGGSAMIFSICVAILYETSGPGEQGRVMSYIGTTTAVAAIAAPVLGGIVTGSLGWEYIFLINVPIGVASIILFLYFSPPEGGPAKDFSMDWPGAAALVAFLVFLVLSLAEISSGRILSPGTLFLLCLATLTFVLFVRPFLLRLQGVREVLDPPLWVEAGFTRLKADPRREFLRARLDARGRAVLHPDQGSAMLASLVWADGLVEVPPATPIREGDLVRYRPFARLLG